MNYVLPRSFYSFETSEFDEGPHQERSSLLQNSQKEKEEGGGSDPLTSKKSKHKQSKHSLKELSGKNFIGIFV